MPHELYRCRAFCPCSSHLLKQWGDRHHHQSSDKPSDRILAASVQRAITLMTVPSDWSDADLALLADVYQLECISRMNVLYYEKRLGRLQFMSFWMEVIVAATASSSGLAAVAVTKTEAGQWLWQALALVAAAVAVICPIYAPGKRIEAYTRQLQGYHANYFALKKLAASIRQEASVTPDHRRRHDTFFDRHVQLSTEDELTPNRKDIKEARERTGEELPPDNFWWPKGVVRKASEQGVPPHAFEKMTASDAPTSNNPDLSMARTGDIIPIVKPTI